MDKIETSGGIAKSRDLSSADNAGPVLPEVPNSLAWFGLLREALDYGRQCADQVAGPLRERIAVLERERSEAELLSHHYWNEVELKQRRVTELESDLRISREASRCLQSELDRLSAEIEALPKVLDTYEAQTKALPVQYEIPERGCSTYNWSMAVIRDLRSMIDAARAAMGRGDASDDV